MPTRKKTIACFGATGGCVGTALANALKDGHHCTALARSPKKLRNFLTADYNIPEHTVDHLLTIVEGDVKDKATVAKALASPLDPHALVDVILSGVGAYPTFSWSITRPLPLTDPTICETAIQTIFAALTDAYSTTQTPSVPRPPPEKPLLVVVSTAGCGRHRGIPLPIYLPYHYLLSSPLADKRRMEQLVLEDKGTHVRDFVIMRPLILTDGVARGDNKLNIGWEWGVARHEQATEEPGPALGYFVSKKDVGTCIFDKVIVQGGWEGRCIYFSS